MEMRARLLPWPWSNLDPRPGNGASHGVQNTVLPGCHGWETATVPLPLTLTGVSVSLRFLKSSLGWKASDTGFKYHSVVGLNADLLDRKEVPYRSNEF